MKRARKRRHIPVKAGMTAEPTLDSLIRLLDEMHAITPTHPELYDRFYQLIGWLLLPDGFLWQKQESREQSRHDLTRHHLEEGAGWDRRDGSAFEKSASDLAGHPAAASPERIRASYKNFEKKLPPELRRVPPRRRRD